jgi:hypothetical protein
MEFFRIVKVRTNEKTLQESLSMENLDSLSNQIFIIGDQNLDIAQIGGIWGEFTLSRSKIKGGLRFALVECPNALAWTITTGYPPNPDSIVIHLTINRKEKELSFIEEIEDFLEDQSESLKLFFS